MCGGGNGNATHDRCAVSTSHAVDGNVVPLLNMKLYPIESTCEGLVPAWDMAEVAFNPFSICGDGKLESSGTVIGDFRGVFGVPGCCEAGDNEFDVRKLRWLSVLLTGSKVDGGSCRECDDGCVAGSLLYVLCLVVDVICGAS